MSDLTEMEMCAELHRRGLALLGDFYESMGVSHRCIRFDDIEINEVKHSHRHGVTVWINSKKAYKWERFRGRPDADVNYHPDLLRTALEIVRRKQVLEDLANA